MSKINAKEYSYIFLIKFNMLANISFFPTAKFCQQPEKFLLQGHSSLVIRYNGDGSLISSQNSTPSLGSRSVCQSPCPDT